METTTPTPPPPEPQSVPFEDRSRPFLDRLLDTVKLAFSDPVRLFSNMPDGDVGAPMVYGGVVGSIIMMASMIWQIGFVGFAALTEGTSFDEWLVTMALMAFLLCLSPVFVVVGLFIQAAIYHVMLLIVGDGQRGYGVTFRAVAYGMTPGLLVIVPVCGAFAGGIWSMILCCCLWFYLFWAFGVLGFLGNL